MQFFWNFLCKLDLLGIGAWVVEVSIEEGVGIILDNVLDLSLGKSKKRVGGVQLISKVDPLINGNFSWVFNNKSKVNFIKHLCSGRERVTSWSTATTILLATTMWGGNKIVYRANEPLAASVWYWEGTMDKSWMHRLCSMTTMVCVVQGEWGGNGCTHLLCSKEEK